MGLLSFLSGAVKPVTDLVDSMHTSDEEKMMINKALFEMENQLETEMIKAKGAIIAAEAKSEHMLTSAWRPITALTFVAIIANNYIIAPYTGALFGKEIMLEIPAQMWDLLTLMIGGYVGGRTIEKVSHEWMETKKKK